MAQVMAVSFCRIDPSIPARAWSTESRPEDSSHPVPMPHHEAPAEHLGFVQPVAK
jgi:hypothetical protein